MRVLVIGGTGNISRGIVRALRENGDEVVIFHRGQHCDPAPPDVRVVLGDRRERSDFEEKCRSVHADAAIDMISFTEEDAASALRAFAGRIQHFIHCSTVMTYGPPVDCLFADENHPLHAQSSYGQNKIKADALLMRACADNGFPVTIIRPSYTFGPGMMLHRMIGDDGPWIDRIRKGKPILSAGDGTSLFQFLASQDAGRVFAGVLGKARCIGQIYNMAHPQPITWDDWHRIAMVAVGREVEIVHAPQEMLLCIDGRYAGLPHNFGHQQVFSAAKLQRDLPEWQPEVSWEEGVRWNIEWMERHRLITNSDEDDLEDRIIAHLKALPERVRQGEIA
ncbi:MAG: NAD-dependent epimerase/dehydratase family protein [Armatimonadetes bacterium]|nr:NAD-dependent epimerase/dehydratase family protein [Armatimonadota bacterium]